MRPVFGLQKVSTSGAWLHFKPSNDTCSLLFRKLVDIVPFFYASSLLTVLVVGSSVGEWLHCFAVFQAC